MEAAARGVPPIVDDLHDVDLGRPALILWVEPERRPQTRTRRSLHADFEHPVLARPAGTQHAAPDLAGGELPVGARHEGEALGSEDVVIAVAITTPFVVEMVERAAL